MQPEPSPARLWLFLAPQRCTSVLKALNCHLKKSELILLEANTWANMSPRC